MAACAAVAFVVAAWVSFAVVARPAALEPELVAARVQAQVLACKKPFAQAQAQAVVVGPFVAAS